MMSLVDEILLKNAYSIDIHGLSAKEARVTLEQTIRNLDRNIHEVIIIHGYKHGNSLQCMVRNEFSSKRIKEKIIPLNPGRTIIKMKWNN